MARRLAKITPRRGVDGKGRALDNIFTERLWRTIKYEHTYLMDYQTPREAQRGLNEYLTFTTYNERRLPQALAYRTSASIYFAPTATEKLTAQKGAYNP